MECMRLTKSCPCQWLLTDDEGRYWYVRHEEGTFSMSYGPGTVEIHLLYGCPFWGADPMPDEFMLTLAKVYLRPDEE